MTPEILAALDQVALHVGWHESTLPPATIAVLERHKYVVLHRSRVTGKILIRVTVAGEIALAGNPAPAAEEAS